MGGRIIQTAALLFRFSAMILPTMILPTEFALGVVGTTRDENRWRD
jgi:hypothetical protein